MTRKEIEECAQSLVDGSLPEEKFAELQAELRENAKSREFFRLSMEVEMLLIELLGSGLLQIPSQFPSGQAIDAPLKRCQSRSFSKVLMAAAAVLVIASVALIALLTGSQAELAHQAAAGTRWSVESSGPLSLLDPLRVVAGSTVRVQSGSVRLEDDTGVVLLLHGPAEVSFPQLDQPVLKHGWLWIDSSESDEPLVIDTAEQKFSDIGTRFGLRVHPDQQVEIHMIEGLVEVAGKTPASENMQLKPKGQGFLLAKAGEGPVELPLAADPFPNLAALMAESAGYQTTVLSQAPASYWKLDEVVKLSLANEISQEMKARHGPVGPELNPGIGESDGFKGFNDENRSIFLPGSVGSSLLYELDIPGGVSREEGGVSFWVRRQSSDPRREVLWLAGAKGTGRWDMPSEAMMYTQLTAVGVLEFCIKNGQFDIKLSTNFSVVDDRWHHIAVSWGPAAVELYVDGRRVQRTDDFGSLHQGKLRGKDIRFGKPSVDLMDEGAESFTGWVDEIAIWSRPLTGIEIADQYEAAKGTDASLASTKE